MVFFNSNATVTPDGDKYDVSLDLLSSGSALIDAITINDTSATKGTSDGDSGVYWNFSVADKTSPVTIGFVIDFFGLFKMNEKADLHIDWSGVPDLNAATSDSSSAASSSATSSSTATSSSSTASSSASSSSDATSAVSALTSSSSVSSALADSSSSVSDSSSSTATSSSKASSTTSSSSSADTTSLQYNILKSDSDVLSDANNFYTGSAELETLSDGSIKVTVTAAYPKAEMGQKDLVPETVNGKAVSDVSYGESGDNYTCTYSFTVASESDLDSPIPATIHMTVPSFNMDEEFGIRLNFSDLTGVSAASSSSESNADTSADSTASSSSSSSASSSSTETSSLQYNVLKSDSDVLSDANKFYTGSAVLETLSDGSIKVTVTAAYPKAEMTQQGLVPETVNGKAVSDVSYGESGDNYTCTYSFTIDSKSVLDSPIPATIHVTVPSFNMDEEFGIRLNFSDLTGISGDSGSSSSSSVSSSTNSSSSAGSGTQAATKTTKAAAKAAAATTTDPTEAGLIQFSKPMKIRNPMLINITPTRRSSKRSPMTSIKLH
ncbi:NEAT domain-containing protein [Secundilactobacillus collinoides]|uniref:NEAT domain-containing protein n=1 Tax=Secundilactobacillus collinoides TaxID=33960 RepID=UPI000B156B72|nr:hypothetical protein [Secundilactobacillus collinoides]